MLEFYTSLTLCLSDLEKLLGRLEASGAPLSAMRRILVTPLFMQRESLDRVRSMRETLGSTVLFDSGGYYVQTGRLDYEALYYPLLQCYRANSWGDIFTLPDHVPTSVDTEADVWRKVRDTVSFSSLFYQELPRGMQPRAMGVVQGRTLEQVDYCLAAYLRLGVQHLGFGSFGTLGRKNEANIATRGAVDLARYVVEAAKRSGVGTHLFGLGAPALTAMIYGTGASSFDSSSWIKAAGFGQVYQPFTRGYNISHRNGRSKLQMGITFEEFRNLGLVAGHECPFCRSIGELQEQKLFRALHNLLCIQQSVDMVNSGDLQRIRAIYEKGSPRYRQEYEKWLSRA